MSGRSATAWNDQEAANHPIGHHWVKTARSGLLAPPLHIFISMP